MPFAFSPDDLKIRQLLFEPCKTREELHDWVEFFLDLDLPGTQVDEDSNSSPLDMVWDCYTHQIHGCADENVSRVLYYSAREGGKSLSESVIEVMLLLHARNNIFHLAAIKEQSITVQRYIKKFLSRPMLRPFVEGDSKTLTGIYFYCPKDPTFPNLSSIEWKSLPQDEQDQYDLVNNNVEVIVATVQSCNGKHGMLVLDEIDVMLGEEAVAAYQESVNIPSSSYDKKGDVRLPLTILTSTRKTAFGLVQNEINVAKTTGLVIKHWNILDVTEACPASRHRPDLPKIPIYRSDDLLTALNETDYNNLSPKDQEKYVKDEGYNGCLSRCKLFGACKGRLATKQTCQSKFLKKIAHVQNQFRNNTLGMAKAQLLCLRPDTTGLVYPRFDEEKHVITPAVAYYKIVGEAPVQGPNMTKKELVAFAKTREIPFAGGMDFGYSHLFAYVHGFKDLSKFFVTHAVGVPELEPDQQLELMKQFKLDNPAIFADPENAQLIRVFKTNGFRMVKWKKIKGTVIGGISCVQVKLTPTLGADPELLFVREVGEDPGMDLLVKYTREHHWKLDAANKPTDIISDDNKDLPDALRYCIMNVFPYKGKTVSDNSEPPDTRPHVDETGVQYHVNTWMSQKIAELTGEDFIGKPKARRMEISSLDGKHLVFDYYGDENQPKPMEKSPKSNKVGGILYDFS
jgi:hypothetical protein